MFILARYVNCGVYYRVLIPEWNIQHNTGRCPLERDGKLAGTETRLNLSDTRQPVASTCRRGRDDLANVTR